MSNGYPYAFNVTKLDYEDVAIYLRAIPRSRFRISTVEMIDDLSIDEWRQIKAIAAQQDADRSGDDHRVVDADERSALLDTDSDDTVDICIEGMPATASRRILNRVAIQGGVNAAGITREAWRAAFTRGSTGYKICFAHKSDAILFKLSMWKRPEESLVP